MAQAALEITEMICLLWCKERVCRNKGGWNKPCQWLPFQIDRIVTDGQVSLKFSFSVLLCRFLRVNVVGGGVLHILVLVGLSKSISMLCYDLRRQIGQRTRVTFMQRIAL